MTPAGRWGERRKHLVPSLHLPPSKTCCILWYLSHITVEVWRDGGKYQEKVFIQQRGTAAPTVRSIGKMCPHMCCSHPRSKSKRNIANFLQLTCAAWHHGGCCKHQVALDRAGVTYGCMYCGISPWQLSLGMKQQLAPVGALVNLTFWMLRVHWHPYTGQVRGAGN